MSRTAALRPAAVPARAPRLGLVSWLVALNAGYRQKHRFDRLDAAALSDMGLTEGDRHGATLAPFVARELG
ncbi:hypothetical protein DXV76_09150 [Rhodobacteraceae bacterium CCMM004]|nr:hypothetical protein DXV76_09150 [Rhodobacteraceae bacterium CCMM004]